MSTDTPFGSASQPRRPQVRCPACGILVYLPAIRCPKCEADMKTGFRPEKSFLHDDPEVIKATIKAYLKKFGKVGLALLIVVLGVGYLIWLSEQKSFFQRLVDGHPALARPYIAVAKAKKEGNPESVAYHNRLMTELRKTGPPPPMDEPLTREYVQMKPGQQVKVVMTVFASVALERYLGPRTVRRTGMNWSLLVTPVYDFDRGVMEYMMDLHLLVNDPRAQRGRSFFMPLN